VAYFSWTTPATGDHPRLGLRASEIATIQARAAGSHSGFWSDLVSDANSKLTKASTYYLDYEWEYLGEHAFYYLIGGSTAQADHAITVALYISALAVPSQYRKKRSYMEMMAIVYDWCYARLTTTQRDTLRRRIWDYIGYMAVNPVEFLWGHSHGNLCAGTFALLAILNDGDASQNATWAAKMNTYLDYFYDGTDASYFGAFRHFGADGGSHKGASSQGYFLDTEFFYGLLFPSVCKSLSVDWWTSETWWTNTIWWHIWHLREDHRFHKIECEAAELSQYAIHTQVHAAQVADHEANSTGEVAQWLYNEIQNTGDWSIWGPYQLYNLLFYNPARTATTPTITNTGGKRMRHFEKAGHVCIRSGWNFAENSSLIVKVPKYYTGGHQMRREGSFALAFRGSAFVRDQGVYDGDQLMPYKEYNSTTETGHRYTYTAQILAGSVGRIFDTNEPAENPAESMQWELNSARKWGWKDAGGTLHLSNQGQQLWPKTTQYQPYSMAEILAAARWQYDGVLAAPVEGEKFAYVPIDLTDIYYSAKCTKYHRHFLWIAPGTIPGWDYEVVMVWDDLTVHADAVGNKVYVYQLQTGVTPTGTYDNLLFTVGANKMWHRVLKPSSVAGTTITGFLDLDGVSYPATRSIAKQDNLQDGSNAKRVEIWPSATLTAIEFLAVMFPAPASASAHPTIAVIDDASYLGLTINGVDCKIHRGSPYAAVVGTSGDTTPPAAPGKPTCTAGSGFVDVNWADNTEGDLLDYDVWRSTQQ
jgi:hypothetical protein